MSGRPARGAARSGKHQDHTKPSAYLAVYRLDACAFVEPAAALLYAFDLLTPELGAAREMAGGVAGLSRFVPDRYEQERRQVLGPAARHDRARPEALTQFTTAGSA